LKNVVICWWMYGGTPLCWKTFPLSSSKHGINHNFSVLWQIIPLTVHEELNANLMCVGQQVEHILYCMSIKKSSFELLLVLSLWTHNRNRVLYYIQQPLTTSIDQHCNIFWPRTSCTHIRYQRPSWPSCLRLCHIFISKQCLKYGHKII